MLRGHGETIVNPNEVIKVKKIEAILVRNYVDTSRLDVNVHETSASISGELRLADFEKRSKDPTELRTAVKKTCMTIEQEIRRIGDIYDVYWKLSNWERVGRQWIAKKG